MIAFAGNIKQNEVRPLVPEVVCPACGRLLIRPKVLPTRWLYRYKVLMRSYFGWCFDCDKGCEVMQFRDDNKWKIYKWRPYLLVNDKPVHGRWAVKNQMPVAAVIVGPGGDYDSSWIQ